VGHNLQVNFGTSKESSWGACSAPAHMARPNLYVGRDGKKSFRGTQILGILFNVVIRHARPLTPMELFSPPISHAHTHTHSNSTWLEDRDDGFILEKKTQRVIVNITRTHFCLVGRQSKASAMVRGSICCCPTQIALVNVYRGGQTRLHKIPSWHHGYCMPDV
jgi:hypothetical protein